MVSALCGVAITFVAVLALIMVRLQLTRDSQWRTEGGGGFGVFKLPPPEIP